jgi:HAD superfamily hydrolase (TIGR01490 family)
MSQIAAVFDVDGTLVRQSTERLFFFFLIWRGVIPPARALAFGKQLALNRAARHSNKSYLQGFQPPHIDGLAQECYHQLIRPRLSRAGRSCLRTHRQQGHHIVILTGSLECLMLPLQQELQAPWLIATRLQTCQGRITGHIAGLHPRGDNKLRLLRELSQAAGFDLSRSYAYADHIADLPLLEQVGQPVAVNPSRSLRRVAREKSWPVCRF